MVRFFAWSICKMGRKFRQKVVHKYALLLNTDSNSNECNRLAQEMVESFLWNVVEIDKIGDAAEQGPREFLAFHNLEYLEAALAKGKGAILASVHVGNWEMAGAGLSLLGYPLHGVAWMARNPLIENRIVQLRKKSGLRTIFPDQHAQMQIYRLLRKNCPVAFVLDLGKWENGIPVKFCGEDYAFPRGPIFYAQRTGAALIPTTTHRGDDGKIHLVLDAPVDVPDRNAGEEAEQQTMQKLAETLEEHVREFPEQWLWIPSDSESIAHMRENNHENDEGHGE